MKVPILVFAFNRPVEILQVLEALALQVDRAKFDVYVFIDGHRDSSDKDSVDSVYNICCRFSDLISFIFTESQNIGLRKNILKGIDYIKNDYESFIVLEDDIILSDGALSYMYTMLESHRDSPIIGHINLWNFPIVDVSSPYISWHMHCWGWGSWTRLWKHSVENELSVNPSIGSKLLISKFFSTTHYSHFYANAIGIKRTWAVLWMMRLVRLRLLSISPPFSLAKNIGLSSGDNVEYLDYKQNIKSDKEPSTVLSSRFSGLYNDFICWFYTIHMSPKLAMLRTVYLVIFK